MKRKCLHSTKLCVLTNRLKVPRYVSVGILESLWHMAAAEAPRGDIGRLTDEQIAVGIGYEPDGVAALLAALVGTRWLDANDEHRLVIHDWAHHAEDAVHMALARAHGVFVDGTIPNYNRIGGAERAKLDEFYKRAHDTPAPCSRNGRAVATASALPPPPPPPSSKRAAVAAPELPVLAWTPEAGWLGVTDARRLRWAAAAPHVDLSDFLTRMDGWLRDQPAGKRPKKYERAMLAWLKRERPAAGTNGALANVPDRTPTYEEAMALLGNES